jgi:dipeptidyl-peptidase 4
MSHRSYCLKAFLLLATFFALSSFASEASAKRNRRRAAPGPSSVATSSATQQESAPPLTLERIFASGEFEASGFPGQWAPGGEGYLAIEETDGGTGLVYHDAETDEAKTWAAAYRLIPHGETTPLPIEDFSLSDDNSKILIYTNSRRVWRRNTRGDYWVYDRTSHDLHQVGGDAEASTLMFAKFSPDGRYIGYVCKNDIYVEDLLTDEITQVTTTGSDSIINGTFDWVYEEEFGLRDGFRWSPDSKSIAYWSLDTTGVRVFAMIRNTTGFYPTVQEFAYPKTGQQNSICKIGVVALDNLETQWIDLPDDLRDNYVPALEWAPALPDVSDSNAELMFERMNRLQNTNKIMLANLNSGSIRTVFTDQDEAWVDLQQPVWLEDGRRFLYLSERDGWRHLYLGTRNGDEPVLLTPGEYDIAEGLTFADEEVGRIYFIASPENATQRYMYSVPMEGGEAERVSPADQSGTHSYDISPCGQFAIHTWSSFGTPPTIDLIRLPSHETVRVLADNSDIAKKLAAMETGDLEYFRVDIGDDVEVDAWSIAPPNVEESKKYPLLVYVYGEPAGQTTTDKWGGSTYLWHLMLAQHGYYVMSFDNHGVPTLRGRDWRKSIYRQIGVIAPEDQAAAVRSVLEERPYIDPERVGVWGWSGGGSMTLHAMLKHSDLYATGMSVAPVPNERYYDTIYQERYMGLPQDNVEGYFEGSTVNFVDGLEGNLLVVHGTGDDNCHYQTTEMLINELIRINKYFTMMAYPGRSHSIREGQGTTLHLRQLLTRYLEDNMPPGGRE